MNKLKGLALFCALQIFPIEVSSKAIGTFLPPLKTPLLLSGNFAELRNNHFHSGVDFKTQGAIGLGVYAIDEGWVSRILVSPTGYGNALYITHPSGITTVYAHLHSFSSRIFKALREAQYKKETYYIDYTFKKNEVPIERGEMIAKSGNSGSSGGPHLHFEIRDANTQDPIDPLPFYIDKINDTTPPELRYVRIYPIEGIVNNSLKPTTTIPVRRGNGVITQNKQITAWGKIGIGLKAYDRMDNLYHIYGVKRIRLYQNDSLIFSMLHERFSFADTRYLNSLIDYTDWHNRRSMVMRLFIDPGNQLNCYRRAINQGEIIINEEKEYQFRLELSDAHGNKRSFPFIISGKKQEIPPIPPKGENFFAYNQDNFYESDKFDIKIPKGALYTDLDFIHSTKPSAKWFSDIHRIHQLDVPLHTYSQISIAVTKDLVSDKSKYYIASLRYKKPTFIPSVYQNGKVSAQIRTFGDYAVLADTLAPTLVPIQAERWGKTAQIRFRISDAQSGLKYWRGEIDGKFVLFEPSGNIITYKPDPKHLDKGKKHKIVVTAMDKCGNEKRYEGSFYW